MDKMLKWHGGENDCISAFVRQLQEPCRHRLHRPRSTCWDMSYEADNKARIMDIFRLGTYILELKGLQDSSVEALGTAFIQIIELWKDDSPPGFDCLKLTEVEIDELEALAYKVVGDLTRRSRRPVAYRSGGRCWSKWFSRRTTKR